jgi:hypothetical protein
VTVTSEAGIDAGVEELTDADLRRSLPCECLYLWLWEFRRRRAFLANREDGHQCMQPSAARLRVHCHACGAQYRLFLCRLHARAFKRGRAVGCRVCGTKGKCRATGS